MGEMTACHLEQPAELSPLNCTFHLYPKSDDEGSGEGLIQGLKMVTCSQDKLFPLFPPSLPKMSGLPKECLQNEVIDFCPKQQRTT